ncbi:MAG: hypothetical protein A4E66_02653 [Syntrophus sp. PtaB.Bin001]|nr:MAG: hypothetical protein A4E66_02653 [Syntrophus sp. PtaB.Bin001]
MGRFYKPGKGDTCCGKQSVALVETDQFIKFHGLRCVIQDDKTDGENQTSQQIHFQGPEHAFHRRLVVSITDQQGRADCGYLPEKEEPDEIIGKNDAEHGRKEEVDQESEIPASVFHFLVMLMIFRKIADRIETDGAADNADNQRHDDGKLIDEQAVLDLQGTAGGELEVDHDHRLDNDEQHGEILFRPQGNIHYEHCNE